MKENATEAERDRRALNEVERAAECRQFTNPIMPSAPSKGPSLFMDIVETR